MTPSYCRETNTWAESWTGDHTYNNTFFEHSDVTSSHLQSAQLGQFPCPAWFCCFMNCLIDDMSDCSYIFFCCCYCSRLMTGLLLCSRSFFLEPKRFVGLEQFPSDSVIRVPTTPLETYLRHPMTPPRHPLETSAPIPGRRLHFQSRW